MSVYLVYKSLFDNKHKSSKIAIDDYDCITLRYSLRISANV